MDINIDQLICDEFYVDGQKEKGDKESRRYNKKQVICSRYNKNEQSNSVPDGYIYGV